MKFNTISRLSGRSLLFGVLIMGGAAASAQDRPLLVSPREEAVIAMSERRTDFKGRPHQPLISERRAGKAQTADSVKRPLVFFEPNRGQVDARFDFVARSLTYRAFLSPCEATVVIPRKSAAIPIREQDRIRMQGDTKQATLPRPVAAEALSFRVRAVGTRPSVKILGEQLQVGRSHYFKGDDPDKWVSDIPNFGALRCPEIYDGIDLLFLGVRQGLKFDMVVEPGGDPSEIELEFDGIDGLSFGKDGSLALELEGETLRVVIPQVYQTSEGERIAIEGAFVQSGPRRARLSIGDYDTTLPLTIDPLILVYEALLEADSASLVDVVPIADGEAVVVGGFLAGIALGQDDYDVVAVHVDAEGQPLWTTTMGGGSLDSAAAIALDGLGNVYVGGSTASNDFPLQNGLQADQGDVDGFIVKLNPAGIVLFSSYLGGSGRDILRDMDVDIENQLVVTGSTTSSDFPEVASSNQGITDGFLSKLTESGDALVFSRLFGGGGFDEPRALHLQELTILVVGGTDSQGFPFPGVEAGGIQDEYAGGAGLDGFVIVFSADASDILYATYLGGTEGDGIDALAVASDGSLIIGGSTFSDDFPLVNDIQKSNFDTRPGAFIARIDVTGRDLTLATRLGSHFTSVDALALDNDDTLYVVGTTDSDFPIDWPNHDNFGGQQSGYLAVLGHRGDLIRDLEFFGDGWAIGRGGAFDRASQAVYVVGETAEVISVDEQEGGTLVFTGPQFGLLRKYNAVPFRPFEYAAKMIVGTQSLINWNGMLVEGVYGTSVNIRNAGSSPVEFSKELARTWLPDAPPQEIPIRQTPGPVDHISTHLLMPGEALLTDGIDLHQKLQWPGSLMEGFLVLRSNGPLDVTAVYTSGRERGEETIQTALDVSQVKGRDRQRDHDIVVFTSALKSVQGPLASSPVAMTFETRVTNRGSIAVEDIDIEDLFVSFDVSARNDYTVSHGGTWLMDVIDNNTLMFEVNIPALPAGQTATITRSVVFPANPAGDALLTNVVTANPSNLDPNAANNSYTFVHDKN